MPDLAAPTIAQVALLVGGGAVAGFINTLAGGGSFLTVPLLFSLGLPITVANATNRVGVFVQCISGLAGFRREGVRTLGSAARVLPVVLIGSFLGARFSSVVPDDVFQRIFAVFMLAMLPVILLNPKPKGGDAGEDAPERRTNVYLEQLAYLALGLYGGAVQAGIGIPLLLALAGVGGLDLVRANSVKVALVAALTAVALGEFVYSGKVNWIFGVTLAVGSGMGGYAAGRFGARIGERLIRPVMAVAVTGFAVRLLLF